MQLPSPNAHVTAIDSYDRTLPLGGMLAEALVLPLFANPEKK